MKNMLFIAWMLGLPAIFIIGFIFNDMPKYIARHIQEITPHHLRAEADLLIGVIIVIVVVSIWLVGNKILFRTREGDKNGRIR